MNKFKAGDKVWYAEWYNFDEIEIVKVEVAKVHKENIYLLKSKDLISGDQMAMEEEIFKNKQDCIARAVKKAQESKEIWMRDFDRLIEYLKEQ